jgi:hypothetical protein
VCLARKEFDGRSPVVVVQIWKYIVDIGKDRLAKRTESSEERAKEVNEIEQEERN